MICTRKRKETKLQQTTAIRSVLEKLEKPVGPLSTLETALEIAMNTAQLTTVTYTSTGTGRD